MKYIAFIVMLVGLLTLFFFYKFSTPLELDSENKLESLVDNQKVSIQEEIRDYKIFEKNILFFLENNLTLNCDKPCAIKNPKGKFIIAQAEYNEFYNSFDISEVKCLNC